MEEIIIKRISEVSDSKVSDIYIDSLLEENLKLDNLDVVELCFDLESKLKITIDYNMLYKIKTVGDLISYIKNITQ
ncbi:MAG: acyl carrier protein [Paludibacter sp.]|nr:acyl carrier protein [Paludibacter sp.]